MDPFTLFLVNLAVGAGLGLLSAMLRPKPKPTGIRQQLAIGGDEPLSFIMGRYGTAGYLEYVGTWGNSGDVPNAFLTMVVSVSDLPVRGLNRLFVNGEAVSLGTHQSRGYPVLKFRSGGADHMWIEFFDGTQSSADSFLVDKFGSHPKRPWQSDMIGRGIAFARITTLFDREIFNGIPDFFFEVDGIELDDPRGDDAQDNPIVMVHQALSGISFGGEWVWGLQDLPSTRLHPSMHAEMDKCDVAVPKKSGGTEPRFRAGAEIKVDQQPIDVISELLESCNARIAEIGGVYKVLVAEPNDAVVSFTDEDIAISETQSFTPFPGLEATYNAIDATYVEPDERWGTKAAPQLRDATIEASDQGRRLPANVSLPMVYSGTQVQRLMKSALLENRRFRQHGMTMPPEWWEYEVLDIATWTSVRNGYSGKSGIITTMDDMPNGNQFIGWKEQEPTDYDWNADEEEQESDVVPLEVERPPAQITSGFSVAPYTVVDDMAADRRAAIHVFWDGGLADVRALRVQVAESWGFKAVIADATIDYDRADVSPSRVIANPAILPGKAYEVRGIYLPFSGRVTRWSNQDEDGSDGDWLTVTTPAIPDVEIPPIEVSMLGSELKAAHGLLTGLDAGAIQSQLADYQAEAEQLALAYLDSLATTRGRIDILQVQKDSALAAIISVKKALVTTEEAFAQQIEEVVASLGSLIAGGFIDMRAIVNETASTATVTIGARATSTATAEAKLMIKAQADGLGGTIAQVGVLGDFYVFESVDGDPIPAFGVADGKVKFHRQESFATTSGGVPNIVMDGDTGFFSITWSA